MVDAYANPTSDGVLCARISLSTPLSSSPQPEAYRHSPESFPVRLSGSARSEQGGDGMNSKEMLSYFGLAALPFTKEIPTEQLSLLPSVEKHLAAAQLLIDTRGTGVLVGKSGTGKSCLLRLSGFTAASGSVQTAVPLPHLRGNRGVLHPPLQPFRPFPLLSQSLYVPRSQGAYPVHEQLPPCAPRAHH